ncbi:MAG: hypothetical protein GVY30_06920 [Chloroflexi bacterium]|nr:hypothetical protein [Chloroflexota bacterium]
MAKYEITKNAVVMDGRWAWLCRTAGLPKSASPDTLASVIRDWQMDARLSRTSVINDESKLVVAYDEIRAVHDALRQVKTLLESLRLDNGVGDLLTESQRQVYRGVEQRIEKMLEVDDERK